MITYTMFEIVKSHRSMLAIVMPYVSYMGSSSNSVSVCIYFRISNVEITL